MKINSADKSLIIENALCWIVVFGMLVYGIAKIVQFNGAADMDKTVSELTSMQLMWAFYGRSQAFAITLGILEVTSGILIFFRKTRLIGCLLATTILTNIILQDIFYDVHKGALYAAILYQSIIFMIFYLHRGAMIDAFYSLIDNSYKTNVNSKFIINLILAFVLFIIFRILEYYITIVLL